MTERPGSDDGCCWNHPHAAHETPCKQQGSDESGEGLRDRDVLALMRLLAPVVENRRHYGLKAEDAEVYARTILAAGYVSADRLAVVQAEATNAQLLAGALTDELDVSARLRADTEAALATARREVEEMRATEAVLRGEIRRTEWALATFDDVVAERDDLRARLGAVEALVAGAEAREAASLSRTFDGGSFGAYVNARDLRAALPTPPTEEGEA